MSAKENLAAVVLYDPVTQNLRATRYGLYEVGFRNIEGFSELSELRRRLADTRVDLLVADAGDNGSVPELVQSIRRGEVGNNPFCVAFLTSWRSDPDTIKQALESGADDVIVRPFSANFMESRVHSAIDRRKKFVVTSDYLGPDRTGRGPDSIAQSPRQFEPPNTLRCAVQGDRRALESELAGIEDFKDAVRRERAVRLAVRLGVEIELAVAGEAAPGAVRRMANELYLAVDQVEAEAARLAAAMVRALSADGESAKSLKLAKEVAVGICIICGDGDHERDSEYVDEIGALVARLKQRSGEAA